MNPEFLLVHYEKIADAPGAIGRLRHFILDLAVQGKLVPQDPNDEPASELLKQIVKDRIVSTMEGRLKPISGIPSEARAEDWDIPGSWVIAPLPSVVYFQEGPGLRNWQFRPAGVPFLNIRTLQNGRVHRELCQFLDPGEVDTKYQHFLVREGDILCSTSGTIGKLAVAQASDLPLLLNTSIVRFCAYGDHGPNRDFIKLFLGTDRFLGQAAKSVTGSAQVNMGPSHLKLMAFPLPPLAEQHRIVAKVDELMALCNRLEAARAERETTRDRLTASSLARLNTPDPETSQDDARFVLDALPALTSRPDQIKQLRQIILNLAVRGKLVPQDPNDEPALSFDRSMSVDLGPPFPIPTGWIWSRLCALGKLKGGGTPSKARDDFWNGSIPWVSPKDMKVDYIAEAQMSITDAAVTGSAVNLIEPESVLFVVRGMILAHSFPVAISRVPLTINQDMKALVLKKPAMAEYLLRALKGLKPEMLARVQRSSHGTCRIEGSDYGDFFVPIPPIAEQHRIVAKVDTLMTLCDRLEANLSDTITIRRDLLDDLLAEMLTHSVRKNKQAA